MRPNRSGYRPSEEQALKAILARATGEFDHPDLIAFGLLRSNPMDDIIEIANIALETKYYRPPYPSPSQNLMVDDGLPVTLARTNHPDAGVNRPARASKIP